MVTQALHSSVIIDFSIKGCRLGTDWVHIALTHHLICHHVVTARRCERTNSNSRVAKLILTSHLGRWCRLQLVLVSEAGGVIIFVVTLVVSLCNPLILLILFIYFTLFIKGGYWKMICPVVADYMGLERLRQVQIVFVAFILFKFKQWLNYFDSLRQLVRRCCLRLHFGRILLGCCRFSHLIEAVGLVLNVGEIIIENLLRSRLFNLFLQ